MRISISNSNSKARSYATRLSTVAVAALLLAAGYATPVQAASPACTYTSCNGKDPDSTGCGKGAKTLEEVEDTGGYIVLEFRYSPSCQAVWARYSNYNGYTGEVAIKGYSNDVFAAGYKKTLAAYPGEEGWTKMVSWSYVSYACYKHYKPEFGTTEWCSAGH